ncbi:MAG: transcriptional regulator/antitoxin, MazE [Desulfobacteraceae bacterium IS3]|nr:MAG: transcriptional regulator/antitoxin, MazE [Desulfobacteraceae bacterium IS3]
MITIIQEWGNEQGIVFPEYFFVNLGLHIGDSVEVNIVNERIVIEPVNIKYPKYNIRELVSRMPEDYHPEETDWGKPMGKEVW